MCFFFFFFNDTATTEIYTLSLHDALPILIEVFRDSHRLRGPESDPVRLRDEHRRVEGRRRPFFAFVLNEREEDRKSTRLNSSHGYISYAVFCLKKKKKKT